MVDLKKYFNMPAKDFGVLVSSKCTSEVRKTHLKYSLSKNVQSINESIDKTCRYIYALTLTIAISCGSITLSIIALSVHIILK